jgi:hypothetical protein
MEYIQFHYIIKIWYAIIKENPKVTDPKVVATSRKKDVNQVINYNDCGIVFISFPYHTQENNEIWYERRGNYMYK